MFPRVDREPARLSTLLAHDDELWSTLIELIELSEVRPGSSRCSTPTESPTSADPVTSRLASRSSRRPALPGQ
jgi:hypothetical protein